MIFDGSSSNCWAAGNRRIIHAATHVAPGADDMHRATNMHPAAATAATATTTAATTTATMGGKATV
jgi:hypothetical protein